MRSIVEAGTGLDVRAVLSNRPDAKGLEWARARGIEVRVLDHTKYPAREAFDAALAEAVDGYQPELVVMAGFMRVLGEGFIGRYPRRIVNIHPSLLPAFVGLHTHRRALEAGVKLHGATVHVVTAALDGGPIVAQAAVPVAPGDTEESLAARVLEVEHRIYPRAVRWFVEGRIEFDGHGRVQVRGAAAGTEQLIAPGNLQ
jgi:phosphoribosylglycinamide formyltransferase-1